MNGCFRLNGCECLSEADSEGGSYRLNSFRLDGVDGEDNKFLCVEGLLRVR